MRKILTLLILIVFFSGCNYKLKYNKVQKLEVKSGFEETISSTRDSYIRNKPITNREYILFLCWSIQVYGETFPEYVAKLIPCESVKFSALTREDYFKLFRNNTSCLNEYILNSYYLDYPVTGLNFFQLEELYKWMSDRYAENKLVKIGYFTFHSDLQRNEDSFSMEAFLCSQYMGDIRSFDKYEFSDDILIPNFRPPFQGRNSYVGERSFGKEYRMKNRFIKTWSKQSMNRSDFLWSLNELYIEENKGDIQLKIEESFFALNSMRGTVNFEDRGYVFGIKDEKTFYSKAKYIESIADIEKDEYGKMPFVYIGRNLYGRPIIIERYKFDANTVSNPRIGFYWLVYNEEIESRYWPSDED